MPSDTQLEMIEDLLSVPDKLKSEENATLESYVWHDKALTEEEGLNLIRLYERVYGGYGVQ